MKGRPPKPAALRALQASKERPSHRARESRDTPDTPIPSRVALTPPAGLVTVERRYWAYFATLLAGARLLTDADVETLADYCRACAQVDERTRRLRLALRKRTLDPQLVRLLDTQARGWFDQKRHLATELGLTAIGRARMGWTGQRAPSATAATSDRGQVPEAPRSKLADLQMRATLLRRPLGIKTGSG